MYRVKVDVANGQNGVLRMVPDVVAVEGKCRKEQQAGPSSAYWEACMHLVVAGMRLAAALHEEKVVEYVPLVTAGDDSLLIHLEDDECIGLPADCQSRRPDWAVRRSRELTLGDP